MTEDNPFIIEGFNLPAYTNEAFEFSILSKAMDLALLYEEAHGNRHIRDYCSQMVTRLKSLEDRQEYKFLATGWRMQQTLTIPSLLSWLSFWA